MKYDKTLEMIVLPHLEQIKLMRAEGKGYRPIAKFLGIDYSELCYLIQTYMDTKIFSIYIKDCKEEEIKKQKEYQINICRAWDSIDERVKLVEDALYKSCFDHNVSYKTFNKKTGEIEEVEQVIPASFNAQRYFLINRCGDKWQNENKDSIAPITDKISSIKVEWKESEKDEKQQERVDKIEKDL